MFDTKKAASEVISRLDEIARDYDHYEYGLPQTSGEEQERMMAVVEEQINAAVKAERERCARIARKYATDGYADQSVGSDTAEDILNEVERGVQDQTTATRRQGTPGEGSETTEEQGRSDG